MKDPITGKNQEYHYVKEFMSDKKTYFCCQETGCTQKVTRMYDYKRHLVCCLNKQAANAEKKQKKISC